MAEITIPIVLDNRGVAEIVLRQVRPQLNRLEAGHEILYGRLVGLTNVVSNRIQVVESKTAVELVRIGDALREIVDGYPGSTPTVQVLAEIQGERTRQGEQNHPDGTGPNVAWMFDDPEVGAALAEEVRRNTQQMFADGHGSWLEVLLEEVAEAFAEDGPAKLRAELVQVAAVAVNWIEAIDRREDAGSEDVERAAAPADPGGG